MKKYFLPLLVLVVIISDTATAQLKSANKKYDRMAYAAAITKYERVLSKDSSDKEVWARLANSYRLTRDSRNAARAYAHAVEGGTTNPENYLYYAEALMQNERYEEAKIQLDKFIAADPSDSRGKNLEEGIANMGAIKAKEGVYSIKKTNLNSDDSDFGPIVYNGGLVFASNRKHIAWIKQSHSWTGKEFYRLYEAKGSEINFSQPTVFAESVKTKFHDGPVCFNNTGSQMYFTRNNIENGMVRKDENEIIRLKIFSSNMKEGSWGIDIPFQYNSDKYSCAHPSLSSDNKTLYFASDMPGGQGGMDIWKCEWNGTSWSAPVNITMVNTKGNEVFPHISSDGILYLASDGLPGLGGLDLFTSQQAGGAFSKPENMGAPMNTPDDDFGLTTASSTSGYFSSNRSAQGLNDDIYFFSKQCTNVYVSVWDEKTSSVLANAKVKVFENGVEAETLVTDSTGKFNKCLNPSSNYEFIAQKDNYSENKTAVSSTELSTAVNTGKDVKVNLKKNMVSLSGRVFNADDKTGVANHPVTLTNISDSKVMNTVTDANGLYRFENLTLNNAYIVKTVKKDCGDADEAFNTNNVIGEKTIKYDLALLCKGDIIKIDNIYYDYNKSDIRSDAAVELDKVVALLNKYPTMKIELRSHTDSRGKDAYNLKLSDGRAKAAVDYIISKGIAANRLVAKGYGETELLNYCKNEVECDDKMHEQNRRTEFKILQM